jgi:preprotein translocase subunit SecE
MANNRVVNYIQESYDELMHKVSWPTWTELQGSAIVVSVASLIIAIIVFAMDEVFKNILVQFYKLF